MYRVFYPRLPDKALIRFELYCEKHRLVDFMKTIYLSVVLVCFEISAQTIPRCFPNGVTTLRGGNGFLCLS